MGGVSNEVGVVFDVMADVEDAAELGHMAAELEGAEGVQGISAIEVGGAGPL